MKKILFIIYILLLLPFVIGAISSSSISWLSKGHADTLYCAIDDCGGGSGTSSSSTFYDYESETCEESSTLDDNTYDCSFGNGWAHADNGWMVNGTPKLVYFGVTCNTAGTSSVMEVRVNNVNVGCNITLTGKVGSASCDVLLSNDDRLQEYTIDANGMGYCTWTIRIRTEQNGTVNIESLNYTAIINNTYYINTTNNITANLTNYALKNQSETFNGNITVNGYLNSNKTYGASSMLCYGVASDFGSTTVNVFVPGIGTLSKQGSANTTGYVAIFDGEIIGISALFKNAFNGFPFPDPGNLSWYPYIETTAYPSYNITLLSSKPPSNTYLSNYLSFDDTPISFSAGERLQIFMASSEGGAMKEMGACLELREVKT